MAAASSTRLKNGQVPDPSQTSPPKHKSVPARAINSRVLTEEEIEAIKAESMCEHCQRPYPQKQLAQKFGTTTSTISRVLSGHYG